MGAFPTASGDLSEVHDANLVGFDRLPIRKIQLEALFFVLGLKSSAGSYPILRKCASGPSPEARFPARKHYRIAQEYHSTPRTSFPLEI